MPMSQSHEVTRGTHRSGQLSCHKVAYVSTITGVMTGPMGGFPATGKEFTLDNIIIQRLESGKVAETWVSWDNVAFLSQLGLMPPPAQTAE